MKKFTLIGASLALVFLVTTAFGQIDWGTGFSEFRGTCAAIGGTLEGNGFGSRCTYEETKTENVTATHSSGDWTVDVEGTDVSRATWEGSSNVSVEVISEGPRTVTACYNSQGNSVGGFATNPNCQPAP